VVALFALFRFVCFIKSIAGTFILLVFCLSSTLTFLAAAVHLVAALTVKVAATVDADSNNTGIFLFLGFLFWRRIIDNHACKGVPCYVKDRMNIGRKDIAVRFRMELRTHLE